MTEVVDRIEVKQDLNADHSPYYGPNWKRITLNLHGDGSVTWEPVESSPDPFGV